MAKAVENPNKDRSLAEIFQNNETQFALARYDVQKDCVIQCHQFVKCRDFMMDVLVGLEDNRDMQIYGFVYTRENPRPSTLTTDVLVKLQTEGALKNFQDNFSILKGIEAFLGWHISFPDIVTYPDKKAIVVWVCGDPRWQQTCLALSLYTYLLKCLTYPIKDKNKWKEEILAMGTVESHYMDIPHLDFLLAHLDQLVSEYKTVSGFNDQKATPVYKIHNQTGFCSAKSYISGKWNEGHVLAGYERRMAV